MVCKQAWGNNGLVVCYGKFGGFPGYLCGKFGLFCFDVCLRLLVSCVG